MSIQKVPVFYETVRETTESGYPSQGINWVTGYVPKCAPNMAIVYNSFPDEIQVVDMTTGCKWASFYSISIAIDFCEAVSPLSKKMDYRPTPSGTWMVKNILSEEAQRIKKLKTQFIEKDMHLHMQLRFGESFLFDYP